MNSPPHIPEALPGLCPLAKEEFPAVLPDQTAESPLVKAVRPDQTEEERVQFLDVLFAVADGDGLVSTPETEGIRRIAMNLKMTHRQFIDAKLKIPRERRTG